MPISIAYQTGTDGLFDLGPILFEHPQDTTLFTEKLRIMSESTGIDATNLSEWSIVELTENDTTFGGDRVLFTGSGLEFVTASTELAATASAKNLYVIYRPLTSTNTTGTENGAVLVIGTDEADAIAQMDAIFPELVTAAAERTAWKIIQLSTGLGFVDFTPIKIAGEAVTFYGETRGGGAIPSIELSSPAVVQDTGMRVVDIEGGGPTAITINTIRSTLETPGATYIVAGDSTRENVYNGLMDYYYPLMLGKMGATLVDSARSGHRGELWGDNSDSPNVNEAIAATPGTGSTTVLEYSYGINDLKDGRTKAQTKAAILVGLNAYRAAKPDAQIVLVTPVTTAVAARNTELNEVYAEISTELSLPLIDVSTDTAALYDGTGADFARDWYNDSTHPNFYLSIRVANQIFNDRVIGDTVTGEIYRQGISPANAATVGITIADATPPFTVGVDTDPILEMTTLATGLKDTQAEINAGLTLRLQYA